MGEALAAALKVLIRRKVASSSGEGGHVLQKSLSVVDITCLGLSTTLGTGIYAILAFSAKESAGPSVVLSFLIAAVASCLGGLCYSELSSRFPEGGSAYAYVYATIGELPGFLIGWAMILEYLIGSALAAKSLTQYIDVITNKTIVGMLRMETNLFTRVPGFEQGYIDFPTGLLILAIGAILSKDLKMSCVFNNVLVFLCFLVIGGIVLVSMFDMDAENWTTGPGFFPNGVAGIFTGASTCFFAFHGYDIIAASAGECEHRIRIVPVGISLAFLLGLVACFSSSVSITLLVPTSLLDQYAPLLQAFDIRHLHGMQYFVIIGAATGLLASLLATHLALSRLLFSLSNDGLLLPFLSGYRSETGTTPKATITGCILSSVIGMCVETRTLFLWLGMGSLTAYMCVAVSILSLRYGVLERLPLEGSDLFSRESTFSDLRLPPSPARLTRSFSDCYLNHRLRDYVSSEFMGEKRRHDCCSSGKTTCSGHGHGNGYGSVAEPRTMAVDFVNESFVSSLSNLNLDAEKKVPTQKSAQTVSGLLAAMMVVMLLMGVFTIHVPRLFSHGNEWWLELIATGMFTLVSVIVVLIVRKPRHRAFSRNSIPCVPLLPICAIWMDLHLIVCLPYSSWLAFVVWELIGIFVYMSYGVWYSKEGVQIQDLDEDLHDFDLNGGQEDLEELVPCCEETDGSSV